MQKQKKWYSNIIFHPLDLQTTSAPPFYILPPTVNTVLSF